MTATDSQAGVEERGRWRRQPHRRGAPARLRRPQRGARLDEADPREAGLRAARVQARRGAGAAEGLQVRRASIAPGRGCPTVSMPTCHDGTGYFSRAARTRSGSSATRRASSWPRPRAGQRLRPVAQGGVTVSHFDTGPARSSATRWSSTAPTTTATAARRRGAPGSPARRTRSARSRASAPSTATCSRSRRAPPRRSSPADQGDGALRPRGLPGRPEDRIVYLTEDNGDPGDGFYRYLPDHKGKLHRGGKLQMLAIKGRPKYNTVTEQTVGEKLECRWVDIKDPDPNGADRFPQAVYMQGRHAGGAKFMGLEGGPSRRAAATSPLRRRRRQPRARSGSTRPTTGTSSAARSSWSTSPAAPGPRRPRCDHAEPSRRHPPLRGRRDEDVKGQPSRSSTSRPTASCTTSPG